MKIVITVVVVVLSLAVAPVMQAQAGREGQYSDEDSLHAESEADVRFTLRLKRERYGLQLAESSLCESYRVRAKSIERTNREFPSAMDGIDLEEFPSMTASWHKEEEARCRENLQRSEDRIDLDMESIENYRSGKSYRCCGFGSGSVRMVEILTLRMKAAVLCLEGRQQLHVKAGVDRMLKNPRLAGIALLDQKAGNLAQSVVDMVCPLMNKYASWARDEDPDGTAEILDN